MVVCVLTERIILPAHRARAEEVLHVLRGRMLDAPGFQVWTVWREMGEANPSVDSVAGCPSEWLHSRWALRRRSDKSAAPVLRFFERVPQPRSDRRDLPDVNEVVGGDPHDGVAQGESYRAQESDRPIVGDHPVEVRLRP